jgi:hypothetical protein
MTSRFVRLKQKQAWLRPACLAIVSLAAVFASGDYVYAANARKETSVASVESRTAGEPIIAIVSLRDQRVTIYDKNGWILRAPVSSGQRGRETPAGVMPICPICNASLGRASRSTGALYRDIPPRMAVSGCPTTSPNTRDQSGHAGDCGAKRRRTRRGLPSGSIPAEIGC